MYEGEKFNKLYCLILQQLRWIRVIIKMIISWNLSRLFNFDNHLTRIYKYIFFVRHKYIVFKRAKYRLRLIRVSKLMFTMEK